MWDLARSVGGCMVSNTFMARCRRTPCTLCWVSVLGRLRFHGVLSRQANWNDHMSQSQDSLQGDSIYVHTRGLPGGIQGVFTMAHIDHMHVWCCATNRVMSQIHCCRLWAPRVWQRTAKPGWFDVGPDLAWSDCSHKANLACLRLW